MDCCFLRPNAVTLDGQRLYAPAVEIKVLHRLCAILISGNWELAVAARDGAGNAAVTDLTFNWTVAFGQPDAVFVRYDSAPLGLEGSGNPHFSVKVTLLLRVALHGSTLSDSYTCKPAGACGPHLQTRLHDACLIQSRNAYRRV